MTRIRRGITAAVAAAFVAAAYVQIAPTRASWVDSATFASSMSAGTWSIDPPDPDIIDGGISPDNEFTEIAHIEWENLQPQSFCVTVDVTGTSTTPQPWQIVVDLTQVPWRGAPLNQIQVENGGVGTFDGPANTLTIVGKQGTGAFDSVNNNTPITNAQIAEPRICMYYGPTPQGDTDWYALTYTSNSDAWTNRGACMSVTATTTQERAVNPFYYGWTATLDLTAAFDHLMEDGGTPDAVVFDPQPNGIESLTVSPPSGQLSTSYVITSGHATAIRGVESGNRESATVTACVVDYGRYLPQVDPSWYTAVVTSDEANWTDSMACMYVTATTTQDFAVNPLYYGWTAFLDLSPAVQRIIDGGGIPATVVFTPDPTGYESFSTSPSPGVYSLTYQITSGLSTAIAGTGSGRESAIITACVVAS